MVGQTIEAKPAIPWWSILALSLAAILVGVALATGTQDWAIAAVWPGILGLIGLWFRPAPFQAIVTEEGLVIRQPRHELIPFASIEGLQARRPANPYKMGRRRYSIRVLHCDGAIQIPARLNVRSDDVYSFLYHRLSSSGSREINTALVDYLGVREHRHGRDRVWTYSGRSFLAGRLASREGVLFGIAGVVAGIIWGVVGAAVERHEWMIGATFLAAVSGGIIVPTAMGKRARGKRPQGGNRPSLVICPDGMALAQRGLVGELRWDEIRKINLANSAIILTLEGADIRIEDLYDRPLPLILQLLRHYWEGTPELGRPAWQFDATRFRDTTEDHAFDSGRGRPSSQQVQE